MRMTLCIGIICEPAMKVAAFFNACIVTGLVQFKQQADAIVANRVADDIRYVEDKVYSRNLFGKD